MQIAIVVLLGIIAAELFFIILVLQTEAGYIRTFLIDIYNQLDGTRQLKGQTDKK